MKKFRQLMLFIAKITIATVVLGYLLKKVGFAQMGDTLRATIDRWPWLLAGFALCLPPLLGCMARWKSILEAQSMHLRWRTVNSIFFIGLFFNSFMIGPTGGDVIKALYTARETNQRKTEAVTTIFIDRIIGLLVIALLVATMILLRWHYFMEHEASRPFVWPALIACALLLGGGLIAFSIHLFEVFPWLRVLNRIPFVGKVMETAERVYNAFYICRRNPKLLLKVVLQSLMIQLLFVAATWCVGQCLSLRVPFIDYLTFGPLIGLVSAIPITPGGLGIREGASKLLWSAAGVDADKAILLAFIPYVFLVIWGLPGGLLFLFHDSGSAEGVEDEA